MNKCEWAGNEFPDYNRFSSKIYRFLSYFTMLHRIEPEFIAIFILFLTFLVAFLVNKAFARFIWQSAKLMQNNPTNYKFLRHTLVALVYIVGIGLAIFQVPELRTIASSMLTGAGILAVVVGFASQHALSNIVSGVFIVVFKPFRVNDRLKIRENLSGVVEDITLRHTVLRDAENKRIIIPNSVMGNEIIINSDYTDDKIIKTVDMNVSYQSDLKRAKAIMRAAIEQHPMQCDPRNAEQMAASEEPIPVRVVALGESSINLRGWACAKNASDAFIMSCDLLETMKDAFEKEGIIIPYPHRTIVHKHEGAANSDTAAVA
jgi:small conductance mechanosensitive channel